MLSFDVIRWRDSLHRTALSPFSRWKQALRMDCPLWFQTPFFVSDTHQSAYQSCGCLESCALFLSVLTKGTDTRTLFLKCHMMILKRMYWVLQSYSLEGWTSIVTHVKQSGSLFVFSCVRAHMSIQRAAALRSCVGVKFWKEIHIVGWNYLHHTFFGTYRTALCWWQNWLVD